MKLSTIAGGAVIIALVLFAVGFGFVFLLRSREMIADLSDEVSVKPSSDSAASTGDGAAAAAAVPAAPPELANAAAAISGDAKQFIYGRITTTGDITYEGRLRFGGSEEAFWGDYFNGAKAENEWIAQVPPERRRKVLQPISLFGLTIAQRERDLDYDRSFMARFGDIARIDAQGKDIKVALKSGSTYILNGFSFGDIDDGIRVWDRAKGMVDVDRSHLRTIELLPAPQLDNLPSRLHGTVRSARGAFTGFIQWDREECEGDDLLSGYEVKAKRDVRFDAIRSIAKHEPNGSLVTLLDGGEVVLTGTNDVNSDNRGIYIDDPRYGRVLMPWETFERVDFFPGDSGPAYGDFPPGIPLSGKIVTRGGKALSGKLVYDLDESETTHTFDAPSEGVDYTIPFGLIASIVIPDSGDPDTKHALIRLRSGDELKVERSGDAGDANAGALVFVEGQEHPEYVPWGEIARVDLDAPPAMYPPLGASATRQ